MPRPEVDGIMSRIDDMISEIETIVPETDYRSVQFRADLAGMLVVAIAATYENCVKEILTGYAGRQHKAFEEFAQRNFGRLSSRVRSSDLHDYCALFNPEIHSRFKNGLKGKKTKILSRTGINIVDAYDQILTWRHSFAHAGIRSTTIEEASRTHRVGKRVLYAFERAFSEQDMTNEATLALGPESRA